MCPSLLSPTLSRCAIAAIILLTAKTTNKILRRDICVCVQVPQNVPVQFVPINVPTPPPQVRVSPVFGDAESLSFDMDLDP